MGGSLPTFILSAKWHINARVCVLDVGLVLLVVFWSKELRAVF